MTPIDILVSYEHTALNDSVLHEIVNHFYFLMIQQLVLNKKSFTKHETVLFISAIV
jgi:hypothetical protein